MAPVLRSTGVVAIKSFGFSRNGSNDKFFIATAYTGVTTYGAAVASSPVDKKIYLATIDTSNRLHWVPITTGGVVGSAFYTGNNTYTGNLGSIAVDGSGNVYISGIDTSYGTYSSQLMKVDAAGTKQWARKVIPNGTNSYNFALDASGNIYGNNVGAGAGQQGSTYFQVVKYNNSGTLQYWNNIAGASPNGAWGNNVAYSTALNSAGTYIYYFGTMSNAAVQSPTIVKTNAAGAVQWVRNANQYSGATSPGTIDSSDNAFITFGGGGGTTYLTKLDSSGTMLWNKGISGGSNTPSRVATDSLGNAYGLYQNQGDTIWIVKWNSAGTIQFQRSINRSGGSLKTSAWSGNQQTQGFHVTDTSIIFTASDNNKAILFKLPSDGSLTGTYTVDGLTYVYAASSLTENTGGNYFSSINASAGSNGTDSAAANTSTAGTTTITTKVIP